jgi:hypothetical protein
MRGVLSGLESAATSREPAAAQPPAGALIWRGRGAAEIIRPLLSAVCELSAATQTFLGGKRLIPVEHVAYAR